MVFMCALANQVIHLICKFVTGDLWGVKVLYALELGGWLLVKTSISHLDVYGADKS